MRMMASPSRAARAPPYYLLPPTSYLLPNARNPVPFARDATPKEPRVGNNGKPFPPRPADEQLANAARQLYHQKRGTLVGKAPAIEMTFVPGTAKPDIDENVPF